MPLFLCAANALPQRQSEEVWKAFNQWAPPRHANFIRLAFWLRLPMGEHQKIGSHMKCGVRRTRNWRRWNIPSHSARSSKWHLTQYPNVSSLCRETTPTGTLQEFSGALFSMPSRFPCRGGKIR